MTDPALLDKPTFKVRAIVEYEVDRGNWSDVAAWLDYRNDGTYCASNFAHELMALADQMDDDEDTIGCLCRMVRFESAE